MTTIKTATGKEFETGYVGEHSSGVLYIRLKKEDQKKAEKVFSKPKETKVLLYNGEEIKGYTNYLDTIDEGDIIRVRLKKDAINNDTKP